jgi:hypothetical protein
MGRLASADALTDKRPATKLHIQLPKFEVRCKGGGDSFIGALTFGLARRIAAGTGPV